MRISHSDADHLICLSDTEARAVVEVCALVVLAVEADPRVALPPPLRQVLADLFEGLRCCAQETAASQE